MKYTPADDDHADTWRLAAISPTTVPMTAHGMWRGIEGDLEQDTWPVVGMAIEHNLNTAGEITLTRCSFLIPSPDYPGEAASTDEVFDRSSTSALIGVLPAGEEPSADMVLAALRTIELKRSRKPVAA